MKKLNTRLEEAMSVTLRPSKSQPGSFKVHSVGSKMKAHGGIKPGERVKDHHIDDFHDSGIKVKYHKEDVDVVSEDAYEIADLIIDMQLDEATIGQSKNYKVKADVGGTDYQVTHKKTGQKHDINPHDNYPFNRSRHVRKGLKKDNPEIGGADRHAIAKHVNKHLQGAGNKDAGKMTKDNRKASRKQGITRSKPYDHGHPSMGMKKEAIERRADRKTIIATDPTTGRKVLKVAPKKEIEIGKGKQESVEIGEVSDTTKLSYIDKRNRQITDKEKMHLNIGAKVDKDKNLAKMRKGVAVAKSKLGEDNLNELSPELIKKVAHKRNVNVSMAGSKADYDRRDPDYQKAAEKQHRNQTLRFSAGAKTADKIRKSLQNRMKKEETVAELKINTMKSYTKKAQADKQDTENAMHKGYAGMDKRMDRRDKGISTANKRIANKQVKMAKGVAFDKRYKGGNMTGASKAIDKIKPGLSDHPKVKAALRRANEEFKLGE